MPAPHHQIAGFGLVDSLKSLNPGVQIPGTGIGIGESGFFVNGMDQVRTVRAGMAAHFRIECSSNHRQTIVLTQRPIAVSRGTLIGDFDRGACGCEVQRDLGPGGIQSKATKESQDCRIEVNPHRPILMRIPRLAEITIVHQRVTSQTIAKSALSAVASLICSHWRAPLGSACNSQMPIVCCQATKRGR